MSEFMERHHPFVHDVVRPTLKERVHHVVEGAKHLGGTILHREAPVVALDVDPRLVAEVESAFQIERAA